MYFTVKEDRVGVGDITVHHVPASVKDNFAARQHGDIVLRMFIAILVIGEAMIATSLSFLAVKNKNWVCLALFIISFIGLMIMGAMKPLSTKMNLSVTAANWIEESVNIVAQLSLLVGCYLLNKKGFFAYKENK